jgi:hypothetical protein
MAGEMIRFVGVAAGALWLAGWLACPRRPRLGDELGELGHLRLAGQRDRLVLLAAVVSALFVLLCLVALMQAGQRGD